MPKFKVEDKVKLVRHGADSEVNLEIGAIGVVRIVDGSQILASWDEFKESEEWWVDLDIVRHLNLVLENK